MKSGSITEVLFDGFNILVMILLGIIMVFPFLYIISYSLSDPNALTGGLMLFPQGFSLAAYQKAFQDPQVFNSILVSVGRTILGPILMILVTSMAAYTLTRDDFTGIKFWRKYFVFTLYFSSGMIPLYILIVKMHMNSSFWVYIIPTAVSVFNMILIKTYIENMPRELSESALVDGANDLYLFWRIIFPLSAPVIAAVVLFSAVGQWNKFIDTQLYNAMNPEFFTLQYVLYQTLSTAQNASLADAGSLAQNTGVADSQPLKMAITVITIVPILVVYPVLQKYFAEGLMVGSIKG